MTSGTRHAIPTDYARRIRDVRTIRGLTQTQLAKLIGVTFATVNRWENGQTRPNNLSWRRLLEIESSISENGSDDEDGHRDRVAVAAHQLDFSASPDAVWAVAEAYRLAYGHQVNPSFASETSLIDPLPHQRLAVYQRMLDQRPLRFMLADDAGAGKTIMTGLYVREMLARRLIRRVLVVPPAGLVGNWEGEMRNLFRLRFRIVGSSDARWNNPFAALDSDLVIVSVDTLHREMMFNHLRDPATEPYDLVVFDEAHKLAADRLPDFTVHKTQRYQLAEALAGAGPFSERWEMPWSAQHLLLLTATPHMGKDQPYYFLWRLLLPEVLSTYEAFAAFPKESRERHFIRRTKEEMVRLDGSPLYPERRCDTFSYELSQGSGSEQELYDETTDYIERHYNLARGLNRSAARLAMGVFQRRMASSTYALMRSFERRAAKIEDLIQQSKGAGLRAEQLALGQEQLDDLLNSDPFETQTADEQSAPEGDTDQQESQEDFEGNALGLVSWLSPQELDLELAEVRRLWAKAGDLYARADESKFERLQEVLLSPDYSGEKFIIFTEHRDTAYFLVRRLEGLGFTDRVALIHGGMPYQERERQVEFFRAGTSEQGAQFLVATDAAGEGINLQFCWLMVNYDIPWNPARLEQRMGRIHRYGQPRDLVIVVNLVAGSTREGRVLKALLDKLEVIRGQLNSDKVFDVIGRLFEDKSIKEYLENALSGDDVADLIDHMEGTLTAEKVRSIQEQERSAFSVEGDVKRELTNLSKAAEQEVYRRLLPGFVRRFVERAAPVLDLRIEGDPDAVFRMVPVAPRALDSLLSAFEASGDGTQRQLTVHRDRRDGESIWIHPGEPLFDQISASVLARFGGDGLRGAVFTDPNENEPYLFHLALVTVEQSLADEPSKSLDGGPGDARLRDVRLVGLRQKQDGSITEWPVEYLLLLKGVRNFAPGAEPLAALGGKLVAEADRFASNVVAAALAQSHRQDVLDTLPERLNFLRRGFGFQKAELAAARHRYNQRIGDGDASASLELARVRELQRSVDVVRQRSLARLESEVDDIRAGPVEFLLHALVVPAPSGEDADLYDPDVQYVAVRVATAYEESQQATVQDVSRPELARRADLTDWPGFDLLSVRSAIAGRPAERRAIEVKGRRGYGNVELSDNEFAKACNMRDEYWLYVVFDCDTPHPRLVCVCDPVHSLLFRGYGSTAYSVTPAVLLSAAVTDNIIGGVDG